MPIDKPLHINPHNEQPLDFTFAPYKAIVQAMVTSDRTAHNACNFLLAMWQADNTAKHLRWNQQVAQQTAQRAEQQVGDSPSNPKGVQNNILPLELNVAPFLAPSALASLSGVSVSLSQTSQCKTCPVFAPVDCSLAVPSSTHQCSLLVMINHLQDGKYIDLWYCSDNGLAEAAWNPQSVVAEEWAFINGAYKHTDGYHSFKKSIPDELLTFAQFASAKDGYLAAIRAAGWPSKHVDEYVLFFYNITYHELKSYGNLGKQALVSYAA
jgi:hypothetical protein